jgi:dihydrofolate reductase
MVRGRFKRSTAGPQPIERALFRYQKSILRSEGSFSRHATVMNAANGRWPDRGGRARCSQSEREHEATDESYMDSARWSSIGGRRSGEDDEETATGDQNPIPSVRPATGSEESSLTRTVVAHMILTLDGVAKFDAVHAAIVGLIDEQVEGDFAAKIADEDAMILGRKTYEEWLHFWPDSEIEPFASHINGVPKYVVSRTLKSVTWPTKGKAHLVSGDLRDDVLALKDQPGRNIGVHGSPTLVGSLIRANVLDLLRLAVFPVVAGRGARLFEDGFPPERFHLVDSLTSKSGVAVLTYKPLGRLEHDDPKTVG